MSAKTINKLFTLQAAAIHPDLTKTDIKVLAILIEMQNPQYGYSWMAVETLARAAAVDIRTAQRSLRRLEEESFIETTRRGGGRSTSSRYRVSLICEPALKAPIEEALNRDRRATLSPSAESAETPASASETPASASLNPGIRATRYLTYHSSVPDTFRPTASPSGDALQDEDLEGPPVAARLAALEHQLPTIRKSIQHMPRRDALSYLEAHYRWLDDIAQSYEAHTGDGIGGWALRLAEEVSCIGQEIVDAA